MQIPEIPTFKGNYNPEMPIFSGAIPKIPSRKWPIEYTIKAMTREGAVRATHQNISQFVQPIVSSCNLHRQFVKLLVKTIGSSCNRSAI